MSLYRDVRLYVQEHPDATCREISEGLGADYRRCRDSIQTLLKYGYLTREGFGSDTRYRTGRIPESERERLASCLESASWTTCELARMTGKRRVTVWAALNRMERDGTVVCDRDHGRPYIWTAKEARP